MAFDPVDREIRVFISSTFKDMSAEREFLINKVFPSLRREAESRRVTIVPVDLRWGITEEEASTGRVASICLDQIDEARPFFLGLVGWRYGWCPKASDVGEAQRRCPRVAEWVDHGMSMTEIEMQYGVLDTDDDTDALFLLKKDPGDARVDEGIVGLRQKIKLLRPDDTFWYDDLETIGRHVRERLLQLMDKYFPIDDGSPAYQAAVEIFEPVINNEEWYAATEESLPDDAKGLVLYFGHPGSGKTTAAEHRAFELSAGDDTAAVYLRCDHDRFRYDREMCLAILRHQLLDYVPEDKYDQWYDIGFFTLAGNVSAYLKESTGQQLRVVVDGLEHVDDWTPRQFCSDVLVPFLYEDRAVVEIFIGSGYYERPLGLTLRRPYTDVTTDVRRLPGVGVKARALFIIRYLRKYAKSLPVELLAPLAQTPITMRLLRMILDEIVAYGTFETLPDHIAGLMRITTQDEFYTYVLDKAHATLPPDDLRQLLAVLAVDVTGLPEDVLWRDVLRWTPLQWAEAEGLLRRLLRRDSSGISCITHDLQDRLTGYVNPKDLEEAHWRIAEALEGTTTHRTEQAIHLLCLGEYKKLHQLVVVEGALCDMIEGGHELAAFTLVNALLQVDPRQWGLTPLLDSLKARLQAADPDSQQARSLRRTARRIFDFNNRCLRNLTFCGTMLYAPFNFDAEIGKVDVFRWILRGDTGRMIDKILSDTQDAASYVPIIDYRLRYHHLAEASRLADKALEAVADPSNNDYPSRRPIETAEIRLAAAYVAMRQGDIDRAHALVDQAATGLKEADAAFHHTIKVSAGRHVIDFLWDYAHTPDDAKRLQASLKNLEDDMGAADSYATDNHELRLGITRALVLLMLTQEGLTERAHTIWARAIDEEGLAFKHERWLTRGEMPFWLEAAIGRDNRLWMSNVVQFSTLDDDDRWLPEALYWDSRLNPSPKGLLSRLSGKKAHPQTLRLLQRRYQRRQEYHDDSRRVLLPLELMWPRLLRHYDDDIYQEVFDLTGDDRRGPLVKAWGKVKKTTSYRILGWNCAATLHDWYEMCGGDGMMRNVYTMLADILVSAYWRHPEELSAMRLYDNDSVRRASRDLSLPTTIREELVAVADCLKELDAFFDELDKVRARR